MFLHVVLWQFDTDGETLHDEDDAGEFERDLIGVAPRSWVDQVRGMRPKDDPADGSHGCFADVEALLDERGAQHEQGGEAAEDDVDQVRPVDGEVVPRHGEVCVSTADVLVP